MTDTSANVPGHEFLPSDAEVFPPPTPVQDGVHRAFAGEGLAGTAEPVPEDGLVYQCWHEANSRE